MLDYISHGDVVLDHVFKDAKEFSEWILEQPKEEVQEFTEMALKPFLSSIKASIEFKDKYPELYAELQDEGSDPLVMTDNLSIITTALSNNQVVDPELNYGISQDENLRTLYQLAVDNGNEIHEKDNFSVILTTLDGSVYQLKESDNGILVFLV